LTRGRLLLGLAVVASVVHVGVVLALFGRGAARPGREARAIGALEELARTRAAAPAEEVEGYVLRVEAAGAGSWSATAMPIGHAEPGARGWPAYRAFYVDGSGVVRCCPIEPASATADDPAVER